MSNKSQDLPQISQTLARIKFNQQFTRQNLTPYLTVSECDLKHAFQGTYYNLTVKAIYMHNKSVFITTPPYLSSNPIIVNKPQVWHCTKWGTLLLVVHFNECSSTHSQAISHTTILIISQQHSFCAPLVIIIYTVEPLIKDTPEVKDVNYFSHSFWKEIAPQMRFKLLVTSAVHIPQLNQ